jgi:hypothetical protein
VQAWSLRLQRLTRSTALACFGWLVSNRADRAVPLRHESDRSQRTGMSAPGGSIVINMRVNCAVVLMLLPCSVQAQPLPPDQACASIVRTLDHATGHRDSNREAVRRGLIACRLFAKETPSPAASADPLADIEPNPRGITRAEVEAAIADWCGTHMQAPLCQKLLRR